MSVITAVHSSSKFNFTPASLHEAVTDYIHIHDPELILLTEINREARERVLRTIAHYGLISGDKSGWDDCGILYHKAQFDVLHRESYNMGETGRWAQIAVFEDKHDGKVTVWAVPHFPSSVETELAEKRDTADARLWYRCVRGLKKRVNQLKRKFKAIGAFISADWNINFKRAWARALIKAIHPAYRNSWTRFDMRGGTHFTRLIDAILFKGWRVKLLKASRLLKDDDSSDHRPFITVFAY